MATVAVFWLVFWVILDVALALPRSSRYLAVLRHDRLRARGDDALPVGPALVNEIAPEHLRGRYNAAAGLAWGVSGPSPRPSPRCTSTITSVAGGPSAPGSPRSWAELLMLSLRRHLSASEDGRLEATNDTHGHDAREVHAHRRSRRRASLRPGSASSQRSERHAHQ